MAYYVSRRAVLERWLKGQPGRSTDNVVWTDGLTLVVLAEVIGKTREDGTKTVIECVSPIIARAVRTLKGIPGVEEE